MTDAHKKLEKALEDPALPEHVVREVLFYVKVMAYARKGNTTRPTLEQWNSYPGWLKLKVFVIALFWAKLHDLKEALLNALAGATKHGRCSTLLHPRNETQNEKSMHSSECKKSLP
jgi:hypothetical protein